MGGQADGSAGFSIHMPCAGWQDGGASQAAATPQLAAIAQAVRDAKAAAKPPDSRLFQPGMAEKHGQQ